MSIQTRVAIDGRKSASEFPMLTRMVLAAQVVGPRLSVPPARKVRESFSIFRKMVRPRSFVVSHSCVLMQASEHRVMENPQLELVHIRGTPGCKANLRHDSEEQRLSQWLITPII
jgi:hypothetical protein